MTLVVKNLPANSGDVRDSGSIPGSGRSPREGHSNPLQNCCLENPMDRSLAGYSSLGHKESDTTEAAQHTLKIKMHRCIIPTYLIILS